jgi:hypothetical protein
VRIPIDRETGRFAARQDTMTRGLFTALSLTSDGASMVMDEGTFDHTVWTVPLAELGKDASPADRRIANSSTPVSAFVSPDGATLLLRRAVPTSEGRREIRYSVMPYDGGAESPVPAPGVVRRMIWSDAQHVATIAHAGSGSRLSEVNVRSGASRNALEIADSLVADYAALPNGWAWIPVSRDRIVVSENGKRREFRPPAWFGNVIELAADRARHRVLYIGMNRTTGDSGAVAMISLADGRQAKLATRFGEDARLMPVTGHDALLAVAETQDAWSLYTIDGPDAVTLVGKVGRPIYSISVSTDMSRAALMVRDYRADAWLSKVVVR